MTESEKLDLLLNKVSQIDLLAEKVSQIDLLVEKVSQIDLLAENVSQIDLLVEKVSQIDLLVDKVSHIENDVTDIKLTLENEIRTNIQRVAKGHLDLSRNLHDAMKPGNEMEMLAIKVRVLETDMREMKNRVSRI